MDEQQGIVIEKEIDAPREEVWKAWTDPEIIKKWWGPEGFYAPSIKVDLRVGGKYVFAMHGPEDSEWDQDMYSAGVYKEIKPKEKLVVTDYFSDENGEMIEPKDAGMDPNFPRESTMTVLFEESKNGKTKLTIIYPKSENEEELRAIQESGAKEGWNSSLEKLNSTLH